MNKLIARTIQLFAILLVTLVLIIPQDAFAQTPNHVVPPTDIQHAVSSAAAARQQNINEIDHFLATPGARQALESAHVNYQQVKNAVPQLSNQELAQLASNARTAQSNFAAGSITNRDLLWILVALGVVILIVAAT